MYCKRCLHPIPPHSSPHSRRPQTSGAFFWYASHYKKAPLATCLQEVLPPFSTTLHNTSHRPSIVSCLFVGMVCTVKGHLLQCTCKRCLHLMPPHSSPHPIGPQSSGAFFWFVTYCKKAPLGMYLQELPAPQPTPLHTTPHRPSIAGCRFWYVTYCKEAPLAIYLQEVPPPHSTPLHTALHRLLIARCPFWYVTYCEKAPLAMYLQEVPLQSSVHSTPHSFPTPLHSTLPHSSLLD